MAAPFDGTASHVNGSTHQAFSGAAADVAVRGHAAGNGHDPAHGAPDRDSIDARQFEGIRGGDRLVILRQLFEDIATVHPSRIGSDKLDISFMDEGKRDVAARLMTQLLLAFDEIKQTFAKKQRLNPLRDAVRRIRSEAGFSNKTAQHAHIAVEGISEDKLTPNQRVYKKALRERSCIVCHGPPGTGKTALAIEVALELYNAGKVSHIFLVKPVAIKKAENHVIAAFKGDPDDKFAPYFRNIYDLFISRIGADKFAALRAKGIIQIKPFTFMRGENFAGAFVIADEMQNASPADIKELMSRLADSHDGMIKPRIVLMGDLDPDQKDTPASVKNGLLFATVHYTPSRISNSAQAALGAEDIKRSKIAAEVHDANKAPDRAHPLYARYCEEFGLDIPLPAIPAGRDTRPSEERRATPA